MWCDIKNTDYQKRLIAQLGEKNAKEFALGIDNEKFRDWFGNGKTTKLENGKVAPYINPVMQVINGDGKQFNLLQRYFFGGLSDVHQFLSTPYTPGISRVEGTDSYKIAHDENRFINWKLMEELDRIYPGLIADSDKGTFMLNSKYQFPVRGNNDKSAQLIEEVRQLVPQMTSIYKSVFETSNIAEALYEIAQQANSSESERKGAIKSVGTRTVEIAQQLYPAAQVGQSYVQYQKVTIHEDWAKQDDSLSTLLQKLSNRFNIKVTVYTDPNHKVTGFYRTTGEGNSLVYINKAFVKGDTPFHEFLHPFIQVLRTENPALYSALANELRTNSKGLEIQQKVDKAYSELDADRRLEESMVTYLGYLAEEKYNQPKSVFNRFVSWLKSLFKKLKMVDFKNLSLTSTLDDIANMMVDEVYVADLNALQKNSEALLSEQRTNKDTDITYTQIFDKIKDRIAILNATIRKRKQGDQFKEDIAALNDILKNKDEITSINNFVSNSLNYVDSAYKRFNSLRASVKDPSNLSKEDISYNLYILGEIQQLLNVFESMSDVQLLYMKEGRDYKDENMGKLAEAIAKKDIMVSDYKNFALAYLTEWLFPYIEPTNKTLAAQGYTDKILTKESFQDQLIMATRDVDTAGAWLGTVINGKDPVSAAVALALKDVVYENHLKDLNIEHHLKEAYEKERGKSLYKTAASEEEFNMTFLREAQNYEQVGVDENNEPVYGFVNRLAYHTEFKDDQYNKDRIEFFKQLGPKPSRSDRNRYTIYQKAVSKFYAQNTQVNPQAAALIQQKKDTLSKRQFEKWVLSNTIEMDNEFYGNGQTKAHYFSGKIFSYNQNTHTFRVYAGELIKPAEKYRNPEFNKMMQNSYYRTLYNTYKGANDKLGSYGLKYGIIPQESKGKNLFTDRNWDKASIKKNILDIVKAPVRSMYANYDSDRTVQRQDGTEVKHIPIKYTKLLDREDQKVDLLSSTMKYSQMANNFEGMSEIEPNILVLKTVLNGDYNLGIKGRAIAKTNAKGAQKINAITKKIVPKLAREGMLNQRLNEFIDDVVFGDSEFQSEVNILGKDFSINKIADKVGLYTTLTNMALNVTGGINNVIVGNYNTILETMGGRFWGKRDWAWANGEYWKQMPSTIGNMVGQSESILTDLAEHYDIPQGEFKNEYGESVSKGMINKAMKTSTLMFLQKGGEHQIQLSGLLSLMHATKVQTTDGKEINLYQAWKEEGPDGKRISPVDNPRIIWSKADDTAFRNRSHAINKSLHGVYNKFDKPMLQRRWYGKMALMFRKYMYPAFAARYGSGYVDYELGTANEGYWNTFFKKVVADAKDYKFGMLQRLWTKEGYNEMQKNAINRTLFEFGTMLAIMMLVGLMNEDDDKSWLKAEAALQLTRMSADISQYISPADFIRVIRNPAATINIAEKWIAVAQQLTHPTEQYQRASGFAKAGDNKLYIKLLKVMPGVRQIINFMTPEEQIKYYNLPGTK